MMIRSIILCLVVLSLTACGGPESWPRETFDVEDWAKSAETERYVFARDIIEREVLAGKTANDVKAILGQPSYEDPTNSYMTYLLKSGGSGFNQIYVLDIRFKSTDKTVEEVMIRGD